MSKKQLGKHARSASEQTAQTLRTVSIGAAGALVGASLALGVSPSGTPLAHAETTPATPAQSQTQTPSANAPRSNSAQSTSLVKPSSTAQTNPLTATQNNPRTASTDAHATQGTDRSATPAPQGSDRAATPAAPQKANNEITLSKETKDTVPNMYAWGSTDNVYIENGQNNTVKFILKPVDGIAVTKVAIYPNDNIDVNSEKAKKYVEYKTGADSEHQAYSGTYAFATNSDGSAVLTMNKLYRDNKMAAEKYAANRCLYVYGVKDGADVLLYTTNIVRAATIIPPKKTGSIVLRYDQKLEDKTIREKLQQALDAPTQAKDGKSIRDQITAASTASGVGVRDTNRKLDTIPDKAENKVIITDKQAYDPNQVAKINTLTSNPNDKEKTYTLGVQNLKTFLVSDLGYKSDALALTVARYDTRIDKPTVDNVDPAKISDDVKNDIKRKLARLNHVTEDKITISDTGEVTINFAGIDEKDAPKIALRDLVLKKLEEKDITVPANDKATVIYNPIGYSKAELERIKQSILEANKNNTELGLTSVDQISLSYVTGNTTVGHVNVGISNGKQENTITVTIKTDKAEVEFTSDVKQSKLTRLVDIRKDYDVSWTKNKLDNRDTDEGLSWSNDKHTTIIYRYDPTKAQALKTEDIINILKATPKKGANGKDLVAGLRDLSGNEKLNTEGKDGKAKKSHMGYVLDNQDEPTGALTLGNMDGAYWNGNQSVAHSDTNLGNEASDAGSYTWDQEAGSVTVAGKKGKIYKARLFVEPYAMTYYKEVYLEPGRNPNNTAKAINIIFVPQTNHKKNELSQSIGQHTTVKVDGADVPTKPAYYNASDKVKQQYEEALKFAQDTLKKAGDTTDDQLSEKLKADIDNATINLDKARAALDGAPTNKDPLTQSIEEDGKPDAAQQAGTGTQASDKYKNVSDPNFVNDDGTPDTQKNDAAKKAKAAYDEALEHAKELKDNDNAPQKDVDAAKAKLDAARKALDKFSTDKDALKAALSTDGALDTGTNPQGVQTIENADPSYQNASPDERKAYDEAVKNAKDMLAKSNASQKEVNEAIAKLTKAKAALDAKATDKSQLAAAEKQSFDNPSTDASKQSTFYKNALSKKDNGASEQEKQAAAKAVSDYDTALANARAVLADKKATQQQVDDAKKKLNAAEDELHNTYKTQDDELTKVLADNFSGYLMPAYFNAFDKAQAGDDAAKQAFADYNNAYQQAKALKKTLDAEKQGGAAPTQEDVNNAKEALEKARKVIDKYATNTSKLSAALLASIAVQNSPAYKNVSAANATPEAQAAKQAYDEALKNLQKAFNNKMDKDKDDHGTVIPDTTTPDANIDVANKDALKNIQAHAQGEPLDRDITKLLAKLNEAQTKLNAFATKTDKLLESINEHDITKQTPAFKNASLPVFQKADSADADADKNAKAKQAVDKYGEMLNKAKELLVKVDATQEEIDAAKKDLDDARKALLGDPNDQAHVPGFNTDVKKLKDSVTAHGTTDEVPNAVEGTLTSNQYRNASDPHFLTDDGKEDTAKNQAAQAAKKAYDTALAEAQELLKKHDDANTAPDAKPTQQQVNEALKKLDETRAKLDDFKTNVQKLDEEAKKSAADGAAATDTDFESTPEFKNAADKTSNGVENADVTAYKNALKKARELVNAANSTDPNTKQSARPTQQQVDEALAALKAAKKQITDNYKTKFDALSDAQAFANGDFKKTPEYKNAQAKKQAGDQGAINDLGADGANTGFDNVLKAITDKLNDDAWKQKATQKQISKLLKQLQTAQDKIANTYKTDTKKLENELGDKDTQGNPVTPPFEASVPFKNALAKQKQETDADAQDPNSATKKLKDYNEKLQAAHKLIEKAANTDPNANADDKPTQQQIDDALDALKKAKQAINDAFTTNSTELQKEADDKDAQGVAHDPSFENTTEYKNAVAQKGADGNDNADVAAYKTALNKAKTLLNKFDATGKPKQGETDIPTQQEVDDAQQALKEIKDKIRANYVTNPFDLQQEVIKSQDDDKDTNPNNFEYTPAFKNATAKGDEASKKALKDYNDKLKDARHLLSAFDPATNKPLNPLPAGMTQTPTKQELDAALKALQDAKAAIIKTYDTNAQALSDAVHSDFANTKAYQNAIHEYGIDKAFLNKYFVAYQKALATAKEILEKHYGNYDPSDKPTQAQVDEALKALRLAMDTLTEKYSTMPSFLDPKTYGNEPADEGGAGTGDANGAGSTQDTGEAGAGNANASASGSEAGTSSANASASGSEAGTGNANASDNTPGAGNTTGSSSEQGAGDANVTAPDDTKNHNRHGHDNDTQAHKQLPKTGDALPLYANSAAVLVAIAVLTRTNRRRKQNRS